MLELNRIDVSEVIDTNKTTGLRQYNICRYWYFFEINFRSQRKVCDGCQGITEE